MVQPAADQTAVKVPGKRTRGTTKADVAERKKLVCSLPFFHDRPPLVNDY
jgi:hypothetical protein